MNKKEITFLKMNNFLTTQAWLNQNVTDSIVIALQPLVIEGEPNILPIQYFLPSNIEEEYEKYTILFNLIRNQEKTHSLSKKACAQIASDSIGLPIDELMTSINWLHHSLIEYASHPNIKAFNDIQAAKLNDIANWVNNHYKNVILFGLDDTYTHQIKSFLNSISIEVAWLLPSLNNESKKCTIDDYFLINEDSKHRFKSEHQLNRFQSVSDEVSQVLELLTKRSGQTILVLPNDTYLKEVEAQASRQQIELDHSPVIKLSQTPLGKTILAGIDYAQNPTFFTFKKWAYSFEWQNNKALKQHIHAFESSIGFYNDPKKAFKALLQCIESDEQLNIPTQLKGLNDLMCFINTWGFKYNTNQESYRLFEQQEKIKSIINNAIIANKSWDYVVFNLKKTHLASPPKLNGTITCILPESLCRYMDYPTWMMGLGNSNWSINNSGSYLKADHLQGNSHAQECRLGLLAWGIQHPKLIGLSMSEFIQNNQDFLPEQIGLNQQQIAPIDVNKPIFKRTELIHQTNLKSPVLSPSKLHDYKRCPYSFYLKHIIKLIPTYTAMSDYQVLGIMIHQVIEAMVQQKDNTQLGISNWINSNLNPLMAGVIKTKMANHWPLDDFINFCYSAGDPATEVTLRNVIDDQEIEGRADIIINNNLETHLIDIKTGRPASKTDIKTYEDIQLGVYIWLLNSNATMKAHYFCKNNDLKTMLDTDGDDFNAYFDGLKDQIKTLILNIKAGNYSPYNALAKPSYQANQCRLCDYYSVCHYPKRHQR